MFLEYRRSVGVRKTESCCKLFREVSDEEEFPKHRVGRGRRACVREEMLLIWDFRNQEFGDHINTRKNR